MEGTDQDRKALEALHGRLCVFKERFFIRLVRLSDITVDEWGAKITCETVPALGFGTGEPRQFTVSGSWEVLSIGFGQVFAAWVGWVLVVRSDLVDKLRAFAIEHDDDLKLMERINKLPFERESL